MDTKWYSFHLKEGLEFLPSSYARFISVLAFFVDPGMLSVRLEQNLTHLAGFRVR